MKKLFLAVIVFAICQCVAFWLISDVNTNIGDEVEFDIVEVEYDGHSYLVFDGYGVVHNQSCSCYDND